MIRKCSLLFLLFAVLIGSSCVSVDRAPEVHGQVTDAVTGKPLKDVKILYTRGKYNDNAISDEDGKFSIGPLADHIFFLYAPVVAFIGIFNSWELGAPPLLRFDCSGYLPQELNVYRFNGNDFNYDPKASWKIAVEMKKQKEKKTAK